MVFKYAVRYANSQRKGNVAKIEESEAEFELCLLDDLFEYFQLQAKSCTETSMKRRRQFAR